MASAPALPRRDYSRSPGLLPMLKTVLYVISLSLGVGSIFAAVWSKFLLPLLYSSFSAREAISERQLAGMTSLVEGLKVVRRCKLYEKPVIGDVEISSDIQEKHEDATEQPLGLAPPQHPLSTNFYRLPKLLTDLTSHMSATESTRASLIATLESFTSHLHTQSFLFARDGRGGPSSMGGTGGYYGSSGVGMNALGENLRKTGGGKSGSFGGIHGEDAEDDAGKPPAEKNLVDLGVKMQDWEDAKREVRAMKGMLLSRRALPGVGN